MVIIISRIRKYLQKKFPLPEGRDITPKELGAIRKQSQNKKYFPCLSGNKHTPVIVKKKDENSYHLKITHGAFALVLKTIIGCTICRQTIEWEKQIILPHFWENINLDKAEKIKTD